mmetsp:Transcript_107164/g.190398  ORF Transcript_107164/g.190398 Transcript_107164/m.190398 type:complete len:135 (-) Transcript_107164:17-421(-)|eukprot:CAMPEP_0197653014 /NCGR_PEP_ID=MMETSP1338-20131121/34796_1 /TAXON_ID=43686 ORGANISM="Pelagodinium beii, Strain RCC1491" /NCGR_SAMPLE_ID=MMETSP1338 /ASSEMBLY_ACC=CAM_ASM_000754 /LENGTH=134 /DNA_ID=CAMNT_0043228003 /DNA_START=48 /DNA_END=452 /DNA_ORIENTATION=+
MAARAPVPVLATIPSTSPLQRSSPLTLHGAVPDWFDAAILEGLAPSSNPTALLLATQEVAGDKFSISLPRFTVAERGISAPPGLKPQAPPGLPAPGAAILTPLKKDREDRLPSLLGAMSPQRKKVQDLYNVISL